MPNAMLPVACKVTLNADEMFFYDHAMYSRRPDESDESGRARTAILLADAEAWAERQGITFRWQEDDWPTDGEYADWPNYWCAAYGATGSVLASLGGIMLRDRQDPGQGDPYVRVVQAQLFWVALAAGVWLFGGRR